MRRLLACLLILATEPVALLLQRTGVPAISRVHAHPARHGDERLVAQLHDLEIPEPTVLPLERFADGLELYRRRDATKVVFTT